MDKIRNNWLTGIRYGMFILLVIFVGMLLGADQVSDAQIEDVEKAVEAQVSLEGMHREGNQMVKRLYGLNANDYEGVILYISDSHMGAEEMLLVKLADMSQAEEVEKAVQTRVDNQENVFAGYGVEQYQLLQEHVLRVRGNYVFFMVHEDAQQAWTACSDSLSGK